MRAWSLGNLFSSLAVPAGLQKRLVSFLLQRAIGHFLEDHLDLEKLDIELSNGIVHLTDLKLNTRVLNELVAGTPLAVTQGRIGSITATIPWRNLWNGQCVLEIDGIDITLAPVKAQTSHEHGSEDQILSSSVDLANDFLHQRSLGKEEETALQESLLQTFQTQATPSPSGFPGDFNARPASNTSSSASAGTAEHEGGEGADGEGVQFVAKLIEKLMARIQIICKGTTIRLRHSSSLPMTKVHSENTTCPRQPLDYEMEIRLPFIAYRDETPGWDQSSAGMGASSFGPTSSGNGSDSAAASTLLEESIAPSVIWQENPESIKTVVFRGFSVWIRQIGDAEAFVVQSEQKIGEIPPVAVDENDMSDSDADVFTDAQESFSQSMMASHIAGSRSLGPRMAPANYAPSSSPVPVPIPPVKHQDMRVELYAAEILSTLQHKNRVKVNIWKNATVAPGSGPSQAPLSGRSLLDIDFHLRSIFIALAPNQIAFLLEILAMMDNPPPLDTGVSPSQRTQATDQPGLGFASQNVAGQFSNERDISPLGEDQEPPTLSEPLPGMQPIQSKRSLSPRRGLSMDPLRASQNRSPGNRPRNLDPYSEVRGAGAGDATSTPAMFLDSSRFLSGSKYGESRPSSSSTEAVGASPLLSVKLKARISTLQMFVLFQDPDSQHDIPTEAGFFKRPQPEVLKAGHLKLELDSMVLRYQQWTATNSGGGSGPKSGKPNKGQIDFALSNFTVSEWIDAAPKQFDAESWKNADQYRVTLRKQYIPLVEFDADQETLIQTSPTSKFATIQVPDRYLTEHGLNLRTKKSKRQPESTRPPIPNRSEPGATGKDAPSPVTKEVVRMRVLLGGKKDGSRPNTPSLDTAAQSSSYTRDVTVEVKPMQVHLDLFTLERLELCLVAIMGPQENKPNVSSDDLKQQQEPSRRPMEQQIMDDLDAKHGMNKTKTRLRLRLNSVQLWVSVPDMAIRLTGQEDTGPEYRAIHDVLAVNISKLVLTQASDLTKGASSNHDGQDTSGGNTSDDHASKAKVDFASVSAFVIPAHVPNFEVTARLPKSLPAHYERPTSAEFSRVPALQAFALLEGEENVHNPVDEEEELLYFKQRTLETSLLVINMHFPLVAVHLEKRILDIFQLRANDLGTWLTLFAERLAALAPPAQEQPATRETDALNRFSPTTFEPSDPSDPKTDGGRSSLDGGYRDDHSEHGTDQSTAYGEELRHQAEGHTSAHRPRTSREYQSQPRLVKSTMASVLVFAQTVDVILDYPSGPTTLDPIPIVKSYQINAGEARIFTAVKYRGGTDTYLSVDAEDLDFWEITAQKPKAQLLTRTIPKTVKLKTPKPMFHMTSMLSFDPIVKYKENDTNLAFSGISWKFSIEQTAVDDVQDFFAEPVGIVYLNPPHQCTRVHVFATLIPEAPTLKSKVQIYNMALFLIDHTQSILSPKFPEIGVVGSGIDARQFWKSLGFVTIGQCPFFELNSVKSKTGQLPLYDLTITNQQFYLETCSDSFETLMRFASYLGENGDMPVEKKKILERLAEAERADNRAKSNVIYQDVLVASLDGDAFRRPKMDQDAVDKGTLEFVEGFYSIEQEDAESDHFKAQMRDIPDVDGFHEVYADLLAGSRRNEDQGRADHDGQSPDDRPLLTKSKGFKPKSKSKHPPQAGPDAVMDTTSLMPSHGTKKRSSSSARSSLDGGRRDEHRHAGGHAKRDSQLEDIIRILDPDAEFAVVENHFSIPILTEEERIQDEGSLAKLRLRVRDFNFSWRLYDGLDWEISKLDEAERKKQARQLANRLYDPNDVIHTTMDSAQSNLEASIFERLSGMQPSHLDRQGGSGEGGNALHRKDLSPSSSDADSTTDYQCDVASQAGGTGRGRSSSTAGAQAGRRSQQQSHHHYSASHTDSPKSKKKLERSKAPMIEFNADKVRVDFEDYISGVETASHLSLRVKQFEIIDNVKSSLWRKFLSHQRQESSAAAPRPTQSNMLRLDLDGVRPVVSASTVEYRLKAKILPLRLYVDQDALVFLIRFFVQGRGGGMAGAAGAPGVPGAEEPEDKVLGPDVSEKSKSNDLYFQSVKLGEIAVKIDYKPKHVDYTGLTGGNFVELMNFFHLDAAEMTLQAVQLHGISGFAKLGQDLVAAWLPHIRSTQVPHMVSGLTPIRSLVNLGSGIADLVLLPIEQYKRDGHIIRGLQKGGQAFTRATTLEALKIGTRLAVGTQVLLEHADEIFGSGAAAGNSSSGASGKSKGWTRDKGKGVADRGHHGAEDAGEDEDEDLDSYSGKRVVATMVSDSEAYMQESIDDEDQLLQHLYYQQQQQYHPHGQSGSSGSSLSAPAGTSSKTNRVSKYANQPADINEGMELAYKSLSKNIGTAAHTIFAVPMEVYERTGAQGSVRAVIRAVPVAVLKPMIGATEAFSKVLIGIRNSIDPAQRLQMEDKYKRQ
ncbi:autophagy- protein 2 [Mortierella alpina]|uniref:Autophagy-related protein 2 n=1 Tax=Mortierella alpina TaxID=64518 RepID=A0A9P6IYH8_MORAP|nr:autophagy- protein 2 [Mortierella alpina]